MLGKMADSETKENLSRRGMDIVLSEYTTVPAGVLVGSKREVVLSHVVSPDSFFVTLRDGSLSQSFGEMFRELNGFYTLTLSADVYQVQQQGPLTPCAAVYPEDGSWYRAEILGYSRSAEEEMVSVRYVDFGNEDTVPKSQVKLLRKDLGDLPRLGVECCLWNARPPRSSAVWPRKSIEFLEKYILNYDLDCVFKAVSSIRNTKLEVELILEGDDLLVMMQREFLADPRTLAYSTDSDSLRGPIIDEHVLKAVQAVGGGPSSEFFPKGGYGEVLAASADSIYDPDRFYLHLKTPEFQQSLGDCTDLVHKLYSANAANEVFPRPIPPGSTCVAKNSEDGIWYRCEFLEELEEDMGSAFAVDFGMKVVSRMDQVSYLKSEEALYHSAFAIPCKLHKVKSSAPSGEWEEKAIKKLQRMLDGPCNCKFVEQDQQGVWSVNLCSRKTGRSISDLLLQNGLAVMPEERVEQENVEVGETEEVLMKATEHSWWVKGLPELSLPAGLGDYLDVVPSFLEEDTLRVYVQPENERKNIVELCRHSYNELGASKEVLVNPKRGQLCSARFEEDGQWYRAMVLGRRDVNSVTVCLLDYGNRCKVPKENVRPLPGSFLRWPPFAVPCKLAGASMYQTPGIVGFFRDVIAKGSTCMTINIQDIHPEGFVVRLEFEDRHGRLLNINDVLLGKEKVEIPGMALSDSADSSNLASSVEVSSSYDNRRGQQSGRGSTRGQSKRDGRQRWRKEERADAGKRMVMTPVGKVDYNDEKVKEDRKLWRKGSKSRKHKASSTSQHASEERGEEKGGNYEQKKRKHSDGLSAGAVLELPEIEEESCVTILTQSQQSSDNQELCEEGVPDLEEERISSEVLELLNECLDNQLLYEERADLEQLIWMSSLVSDVIDECIDIICLLSDVVNKVSG